MTTKEATLIKRFLLLFLDAIDDDGIDQDKAKRAVELLVNDLDDLE